jgi:hypothetical protein
MQSAITRRSDLLLSLLWAQDSTEGESAPITGITRLEKLLFLLKQEYGFLQHANEAQDFHFVPFRMGPWTGEVYDELDFLESLGLLERRAAGVQPPEDSAHDEELITESILDKYQKSESSNIGEQETYILTRQGREKAMSIWNRLSENEKHRLIAVKSKFNQMNLRQLLRYVYKKHPEYTTESEIKNILGL